MLNVIMKFGMSMLLYTVPLTALVMTMFTFGNTGLAMPQGGTISMRFSTFNIARSGPVTQVVCEPEFPSGSTDITFKWILADKILAENDEVKAADLSRYGASLHTLMGTYSYRLLIHNAMKEDEGLYQCQIEYHWMGTSHTLMEEIQVDITHYLPPLNYPECNIEPSTTLINGQDARFKCTPGESYPPVNLNLTLERRDGSSVKLGDATVTKVVTLADNNAMFLCQMTSDTFLNAYRKCSTGPLIVLNGTIPTIKTSEVAQSSKTTQSSTYTGDGTPHDSNSTTGQIGGIVGGISAAILILMIVVIVICFLKQSNKEKSEEVNPVTPSNTESHMELSTDNIYTAETITDVTDVNESAASLSQQSAENTASNQNGASQIPVYAMVHKTDNSDTDSPESRQYGDTTLSNPKADSSPPIYGKVNKGSKTKVKDDVSNRDSSGFVDNTLYIASGPF